MFKYSILFLILNLLFLFNCSSGQTQFSQQNEIIKETRLYKNKNFYKFSNSILNKYVSAGKVNYKGLKNDPEFNKAKEELSSINPNDFKSKEEKLAFWINVYNIFTLDIILKNYPLKSINQLHLMGSLYIGYIFNSTIWDTYKIEINKNYYNLNTIEHQILRKELKDYRIHSAIVCASISCPPLRSEAYDPSIINDQLDEQMKIFLSQLDKNYLDKSKNKLYLSKIFDWFKDDFTKDNKDILLTLKLYLPKDWEEFIEENKPDIDYTEYNWNLNE